MRAANLPPHSFYFTVFMMEIGIWETLNSIGHKSMYFHRLCGMGLYLKQLVVSLRSIMPVPVHCELWGKVGNAQISPCTFFQTRRNISAIDSATLTVLLFLFLGRLKCRLWTSSRMRCFASIDLSGVCFALCHVSTPPGCSRSMSPLKAECSLDGYRCGHSQGGRKLSNIRGH